MKWHASVVKGEIEVIIIIKELENILYKDKYQIIINPKNVKANKKLSLNYFLKNIDNHV